ncbi:assimilatory nitrate reductase NasA [Haloparvum sedimenti]|uniref:assimilatory nitrate reductase NasA n=1 Tax=Haloparvum sedimenti TaxID=1678448 RepID=UPI000AE60468|nr:assimilatory nitrate reductase NasA [Haloparvum sedimenti]
MFMFYRGRHVTDLVPTTCMRCAVGCGHVQRAVERGMGLDVVRGDATHPVNEGLACGRGVGETADPDGQWLTRPLVRRGGELVPTTWDVALDAAVSGIRAATADDPDGLAVLGSGQQTNEAAYALGKLARGGVGTRHYDANTTLCMSSAVAAYVDAFGSDAPPPTYDDIPAADRHVVWGANPAVAHPVMFRWIADAADEEGRELVVVDPVETKTAGRADRHVQPDPGGDHALARAVLARLVETDGVDRGFVAAHTTGFDDLVADLPVAESAAAEAGVSLADVDALAATLAHDTLIYWGMGINQSVRGTATAGALIDLCLASGNLGRGSGPFSLTGQANSMGTRICSSKGSWPGRRPFADPDERRLVADHWGVPVSRLPDDTGPGPVEMLDAVGREGSPDAVWTVATNPAVGFPDATAVREALDDAFLIAQDAFRTETVEHADVVLPAATWGESEGTTTNMERRISRVRAATETPAGVRSDCEIIVALAGRLAPGLFADTGADPEALFEEFAALTAGTTTDCSGIGYPRLDAEGAVRWPAPDTDAEGGYRYLAEGDADVPDIDADPGTDADAWSFPTPSGRAAFSTRSAADLPDPPDGEYPLTLTTGREADGYNSGVRSRGGDGDGLVTARLAPETLAEVGIADEAEEDRDGDASGTPRTAVLASERGRVEVAAEADPAVPVGLVWLPIHHPATNEMTTPAVDPVSAEPNFKQCAVRLSLAADAAGAPTRTPEGTPSDD